MCISGSIVCICYSIVYISGSTVTISGNIVCISGSITHISGSIVCVQDKICGHMVCFIIHWVCTGCCETLGRTYKRKPVWNRKSVRCIWNFFTLYVRNMKNKRTHMQSEQEYLTGRDQVEGVNAVRNLLF
jgi:hypothetical protein